MQSEDDVWTTNGGKENFCGLNSSKWLAHRDAKLASCKTLAKITDTAANGVRALFLTACGVIHSAWHRYSTAGQPTSKICTSSCAVNKATVNWQGSVRVELSASVSNRHTVKPTNDAF